jgi:hypothetical protein
VVSTQSTTRYIRKIFFFFFFFIRLEITFDIDCTYGIMAGNADTFSFLRQKEIMDA